MELTNRARYAVTAMLHMARQAQPVALPELARRQSLSHAYLHTLLLRLCAHDLLVRGADAEVFWLARAPADIALADIVSAAHDRTGKRRRGGDGKAQPRDRRDHRLGQYLWEALNQRVLEFLAGISLADLLAQETLFSGMTRRARKPRLRAVSRPASE